MEQDWVKVYSTADYFQAELIKAMLIDNDIETVLLNKKDSAYLIGELDLYVRVEQVIPARQIITTFLQA